MKILLDSTNQMISKIVEICCERVGAELNDDADADFIIKDVDGDIDILEYDQNKTIFLISKDKTDFNTRFKITKPFLPAELINLLSSLDSIHNYTTKSDISEFDLQKEELEAIKNEKISQDILNLTQIVKEIDDLNDEHFYDLKDIDGDQNNLKPIFSDEDLGEDLLKEKTIEDIAKELDEININDINFIDILGTDSQKNEQNLEDVVVEFKENNESIHQDSFADVPINFYTKEPEDEPNLEDIAQELNEKEVADTNFNNFDFSDEHPSSEEISDKTTDDIKIDKEDEILMDQASTIFDEKTICDTQKDEIDAKLVPVMSFNKSFEKHQSFSSKKEIKDAIKKGLSENITEFFSNEQVKDVLKNMKIKIKISFEDR